MIKIHLHEKVYKLKFNTSHEYFSFDGIRLSNNEKHEDLVSAMRVNMMILNRATSPLILDEFDYDEDIVMLQFFISRLFDNDFNVNSVMWGKK